MAELRIIEDDLHGAQIAALLTLHLAEANAWSPPGSVHAMPLERLREDDVTLWSAWAEGNLAGCGALKALAPGHGEIKSMRVHPDYRRTGVGRAILEHLLAQARARGYTRVSLETGRPEPFLPARTLYAAYGFAECPPFAQYVADDFSLCMSLAL